MRQRTITITGTGIHVANSYATVKTRKHKAKSKPHEAKHRTHRTQKRRREHKAKGGGFFDW